MGGTTSCGGLVRPSVTRGDLATSFGPNGAFRYVSRPPLGGFSKPRPLAVVGYLYTGRVCLLRRHPRTPRCRNVEISGGAFSPGGTGRCLENENAFPRQRRSRHPIPLAA